MIPSDINLEKLNGPKRGQYPAIYLSDDLIYWNEDHTKFVLIYTIYEHSMMDEAGCIAWGFRENNQNTITANPNNFFVRCWGRPACKWISNNEFIIKTGIYDPERASGQKMRVPLVAINFDLGFHIVEGTDRNESRPSDPVSFNADYQPFSVDGLIHVIRNKP